jgi:hypothetical protein
MLQKFLHGLAFGAGFAVAMLVISSALSWAALSFWSAQRGDWSFSSRGEVDAPPQLSSTRRFLGTTGVYSNDFLDHRSGDTLAAGDGRIVGKVLRDEQPASGVTLRLALNGSVTSQWATTDATGAYTVAVPFGRYRIDGYEIQWASAQRVLAGKIDSPRNLHSSGEFEVSQDSVGEGLTLRYIDPVVVLGPAGDVPSSGAVVVSWEPYTGAARYRVQLWESDGTGDGVARDAVFPWNERPQVSETSVDLTAAGVILNPGSYYTIEIYAMDANGRQLSQTARTWQEANFRFVATSTVPD